MIASWSGPDKWSPFVGKGLTTTLSYCAWILATDGDHPSKSAARATRLPMSRNVNSGRWRIQRAWTRAGVLAEPS
jgi:hypothetical protein